MKLNTIGIPSYAGALYSGTEVAPQAIRLAGLLDKLSENGFDVSDSGDVKTSELSIRHNIPPIRNWPLPRHLWENIIKDSSHDWFSAVDMEIILGGDCSIVVGTFQRLLSKYGVDAHLVVIDAHFDGVSPRPEKCLGAAASGLWFLMNDSVLWNNPTGVKSSQIHVLGCQQVPEQTFGIEVTSLEQIRENGVKESIFSLLARIPKGSKILLHFDVDVIGKEEMPSAYSPSNTGLTLSECSSIFQELFQDERIIGIEITELSGLRDINGESARSIVSLLVDNLTHRSQNTNT